VGHGLRFNGIGNQFAGRQRVAHAGVIHGDAIADPDGRHQDGSAPRHAYAGLDGLGNLVEVNVARNNFVEGGDHADERALHFLGGEAKGIKKGPVRGAFRTLENHVAGAFWGGHVWIPCDVNG